MNKKDFEDIINDKPTSLYLLESNSVKCYVTNYGARIVSLQVPNEYGTTTDVVLGFNSIDEYLHADEQYHGATVGRYANRIANATFTLKGTTYNLNANNNGNSLHGGPQGFHTKVWDVLEHNADSIKLKYTSPHMEEGFPGDLYVIVEYKIQGSDVLITYKAQSSEDTVVNLTHHSYFNLNGEGSGSIEKHQLLINSMYFTPISSDCIPDGSLRMVHDTPFDFSEMKPIGQDINEDDEQLFNGNGYDHNFVIANHDTEGLNYTAVAIGDDTKIQMEVWTTEPGVQLYTANFLSGKDFGKSGKSYGKREAFCLETQHFPNSPNIENFPSVILKKDAKFVSKTEYRFTVNDTI